ncbi:MAG: agmatinase [Candidatus Margulisiibacteriota bacterium]
MTKSKTFLEIEKEYYNYDKSKFIVIPCPHEATTSYGKGTKNGPAAILAASQQIETFDEEVQFEPYKKYGVYTLPPQSLKKLPAAISKTAVGGKIPIVLGGEHSITPSIVKALAGKYKELSVLQFDAHADLRDTYKRRKDSHACVMRRILEICPAVQVGVRSISADEYRYARETGQIRNIHWGKDVKVPEKIINQLSKNVYITFDTDVFDPSVVLSVGTPEPGGLFWYDAINILKSICLSRNVVGFDMVELSPRKNEISSDFTAAKLIHKVISYISLK